MNIVILVKTSVQIPAVPYNAFQLWAKSHRAFSQAVPQMPNFDYQPKKYVGPSYEQVKQIRARNLLNAFTPDFKEPLLIHDGKMQWLFDYTGRRYLDMFGGIVTISVGHCHPKVKEAAEEQLSSLWHTTSLYMNPKLHEYAEKLTSKFPGDLKVVYFVNSGSEANDFAMFLARLHTKNLDIISLRNSYHGMSPFTMGLTAQSNWKNSMPTTPGIHHAMHPDVYQGLWGGSHCRDSPVQTTRHCDCKLNECNASNMYYGELEEVFKYSVPRGKVAGFFAESIQGVGGAVQYTKGFLKKASELVRKNGGVYIADEVIEEEKMQENAHTLGTYLLKKLSTLRDQFECVGDVRGKGLMIGVEMVTDKETKTPLSVNHFQDILEDCKHMGVILGKGGMYGNIFRLKPPMCITKEDVDFAFGVLQTAIQKHTKKQ